MTFPNKAGDHSDTDDILRAELHAAGIQTLQEAEGKPPEYLADMIRRQSGEVVTSVIGVLHGWKFERAWYYWMCSGPGIEITAAEKLNAEFGNVVRVSGYAGGKDPREAFKGLAVGHYHVDTPGGLKALADTIKRLCSSNLSSNEVGIDWKEVIAYSSKLKNEGKVMEATKYYRGKAGCSLREAHDFVVKL